MLLERKCFKIDRPNAKAMIQGFVKNGRRCRQSIWLSVRDLPSPALITYQRARTPYQLSGLGEKMNAEEFTAPLKYVAILAAEFFIRNDIQLWTTLCSNGLFDIWHPNAPHSRFAAAKSKPAKFRIQLLRILEIEQEYSSSQIDHASSRIDRIRSSSLEVSVRRTLLTDSEFFRLTKLLEKSVNNYLISNPKYYSYNELLVELEERSKCIESQEDIDSMQYEEEYFEGTRHPRLSNYYERNPRLRAAAISHHGTVCKICGFDFVKHYGSRGDGYIEVHHLIPVSSLCEETAVDPVSEMTVLCSNCHRMIHRRRDDLLTPENLAEYMDLARGYGTI